MKYQKTWLIFFMLIVLFLMIYFAGVATALSNGITPIKAWQWPDYVWERWNIG